MMFTATSVDVKCLFSCGHVLLSHTCNHLSTQSVHALLCLGSWSGQGYVFTNGIKLTSLEDIEGDEDVELAVGWDAIAMD
ncbi:hypothetical protein EDC04DRAFT_2568110 [Pisolithus marmoratus]|nr:hypothetical protein EDC04DRAFT_2568110 [Pisolithus marmoratus]